MNIRRGDGNPVVAADRQASDEPGWPFQFHRAALQRLCDEAGIGHPTKEELDELAAGESLKQSWNSLLRARDITPPSGAAPRRRPSSVNGRGRHPRGLWAALAAAWRWVASLLRLMSGRS